MPYYYRKRFYRRRPYLDGELAALFDNGDDAATTARYKVKKKT